MGSQLVVLLTGALSLTFIGQSSAGPMVARPHITAAPGIIQIDDGFSNQRWRAGQPQRGWQPEGQERRWSDWRNGPRYDSGVEKSPPAANYGPSEQYDVKRQPYRKAGVSRSHIRYCVGRYLSYRAWDNTYLAHSGLRRQCLSPNS